MKNAVETIAYENLTHSGKRKKETNDTLIPSILEPERSSREYRKKLGQADSEDLCSKPPDLPEISGQDKDHQLYRE